MARTTRPVTSDYDYNVVMEDMLTPDGKKTGWKCTHRLDTGQVIAPVTKDYEICQNADVIDTARSAFEEVGLDNYNENINVCRDGAVMRAVYDFPEHTRQLKTGKGKKVGDEVGLRLTVNNSFDRSRKVSFDLGMLRLVCTNGMTTMEKELSIARKHSSKLSLDFIVEAVNKAVTKFDSLMKEGNIFDQMAQYEIDQEQGLYILHNLVKNKTISEVTREGIAQVWNNPRQEDEGRNVYNLLNASTDYLTHQVADTRFELADRVTQNVTKRLVGAVRKKSAMDKLLIKPEVEAEVAIN